MYDELGDVLLQVVFHALIGENCGEFNMNDITTAITSKMIARHPFVFDAARKDDPTAHDWEQLKRAEKGLVKQSGVMDDIPLALPALTRAAKVQRAAGKVGFDWDTPEEALPKVHEEAE